MGVEGTKVPGTEFVINSTPDGDGLHLVERPGFAFRVLAQAALLLKADTGKEVYWDHNDTVVSTTAGTTIDELQSVLPDED